MAATKKAVRAQVRAKGSLDIDTLEQSFAALAPRGAELVERFYNELFKRFPQVKPLFANTTPKQQQTKLLAALSLVVNNLRKPAVLNKALRELGARHKDYGAVAAHYGAVASTLLDVMKDMAGPVWTDTVAQAWSGALNAVAEKMLGGYGAEDTNMAAVMKTKGVAASAEIVELRKMHTAVDNAMTAIMMIDRNLVINYANKSTIALLKKHEPTLRTIYPAFNVEKLVGTCIDIFHKNPAHQRTLLSDPARLPYSTDIQVGPLVFRINVTALRDDAG
ncbi:MAG: methyl-accepting chemotaxis protein, partial [Gammaproteobacteria bacterium]|nr:methyl-accepting chemotaxis protein [Gammaproteobacteria bacterium]